MPFTVEQKNEFLSNVVAEDIQRSGAPDYENNIRTKFPGYNIFFIFPTSPEEQTNKRILTFPAYIDSIDDDYQMTYNPQEVYGRMDSIPTYQRTQRSISFDLKIPSNGLEHSREIARKLNVLVQNAYPSYQKSGNVNIISSPPLVKILFSNLIYDSETQRAILGYFTNGIKITHNLSEGVFSRLDGFETYPKSYDLSFGINVLHRYTPGFNINNNAVVNPVNILGGIERTFLKKG